ncbi:MAG: hypothetical protein WDN04_04945 [Rhodospirillales bacterium]
MLLSTKNHRATPAAAVLAIALGLVPAVGRAQTWTTLSHPAGFTAGAMLLLTDGTVMVQDQGTCGCGGGNWWRLTPDNTGSYLNGSWSQLATMPSGYKPLYFASAVLPDGRVIVNGGEYNGSSTGSWTTKGALYDPAANTWVNVAPPHGWTTIGDAQSTLLNDGTYMLANCCTTDAVTLNPATMTWTAVGTGKADINDEEGWTLLPSGQLLTADANNTADVFHTEIYTNGKWTFAGDSPVLLADIGSGTSNSHELGPQVLRPDGTVFIAGATGNTAVYTIKTKKWSAGPAFPKVSGKSLDEADGPGSLLPDGNVLLAASPGVFKNGVKFFEFDGTSLNAVPGTPNAAGESSFQVRLLLLPTGEVLETDGSTDVELYKSTGSANPAWAPVVSKFPAKVKHGQSYTVTGKYLNGFSQAVAYGDDYQASTNYPLVRITNTASGHVAFAKTSEFSSMAVANPKKVTASVLIPAGIEKGASTLEVVANGIASAPRNVTIK